MPTRRKSVRRRIPDASTISTAKADSIRACLQAHDRAAQAFDPKRYKRGGGWTPAEMREIAKIAGCASPSNEDRGALELFDFVHSPPDKYFLYIDKKRLVATTWTGDVLGPVAFDSKYKSPGFGQSSTRVPVTVRGINGVVYVGTYFASAGNYARVRARKGARRL